MARRVGAFIEVLGAYIHKPPPALIRKHANVLSGGTLQQRISRATRELSRAVLIEAFVHHPTQKFNFDVRQRGKGMNSFAWDPFVLTLDGRSVIGRVLPPGADTARFTVWIHAFDPRQKLKTPYGDLPAPPLAPMPRRLQTLVPYTVID